MKLFNQYFKHPIRFLDHTTTDKIFGKPNRALLSFALDDAIATMVGAGIAPPTIRLWVHERTLVLGIPDSRLPHLEEAVHFMQAQQYDTIIRNSGGLAVLLDKHVLNMSFILPNKDALSIHEGYDLMYRFITLLFQEETNDISAYEIVGSYCPGDYDLSIDGKKFAGISQRRVRDGVSIQIYLDIAGDSSERAATVRDFYQIGVAGEQTKYRYPEVNPQVMASLSDLIGCSFTVPEIIARIESLLSASGTRHLSTQLLPDEETLFKQRLEQMNKRNEKIIAMTQKK